MTFENDDQPTDYMLFGEFFSHDEKAVDDAVASCPMAFPGLFLWHCQFHNLHGTAYSMVEAAEMAMAHERAARSYPTNDDSDYEAHCGVMIVEVPEREGVTTIHH